MDQGFAASVVALFVIVGLAIAIGFVFLGAWLFRIRLDFIRVTLSLLASITAGTIVGFLVGPALRAAAGSVFSPGVASVVNSLILVAVGLLVFGACLSLIAEVSARMGWALALFTAGAQYVLLGLILLYLVGAGSALPIVSSIAWGAIAAGAALLGGGYWLGSSAAGQPVKQSLGFASASGGVISAMTIEPPPPLPPNRPTEGSRPTEVPSPPAAAGWLVLSVGQEKGRRFDLRQGDNRIGRSSQCEVRVTGDEEISREHCLIRVSGQSYELHDLAARNGTFLNDSAVRGERMLADGDQIRIGNSVLTFKQVG
jgi:hypothetical protein